MKERMILLITRQTAFDRKLHRKLKQARIELRSLYARRGKPAVKNMSTKSFEREAALLDTLRNTALMPTSWLQRAEEFKDDQRRRELEECRSKLLALYKRRGRPRANEMDAQSFTHELKLLEQLKGTKYLPKQFYVRLSEMDREHQSRVNRMFSVFEV